jgi:hypothetical protein
VPQHHSIHTVPASCVSTFLGDLIVPFIFPFQNNNRTMYYFFTSLIIPKLTSSVSRILIVLLSKTTIIVLVLVSSSASSKRRSMLHNLSSSALRRSFFSVKVSFSKEAPPFSLLSARSNTGVNTIVGSFCFLPIL